MTGSSSDGGLDGKTSGPCTQDSDCATSYRCMFDSAGGCNATKICVPVGACKGMKACACDGTDVLACGIGAPKPIAHTGSCNPDASQLPVACEISDTSGYSPVPQAKPIAASGACTQEQIASFVQACVGATATNATCMAWQQSDAGTCGACVMTQASASTWGPLVCDVNGCKLDVPGCIDVTLGQEALERNASGNGSCGDFLSDEEGCVDFACAACAGSDRTQCESSALTNECKNYGDAATNAPACSTLDAGATACFPQSDSDYAAFVNVFCGTGP
jgi:hypothetical protein